MHVEVAGEHQVASGMQTRTRRGPSGSGADDRAGSKQDHGRDEWRNPPHVNRFVAKRTISYHPPADRAISSKAIAQITTKWTAARQRAPDLLVPSTCRQN